MTALGEGGREEADAEPGAGTGPDVQLVDPAILEEVAALEAAQPAPSTVFSWPRSIAWSLAFALVGSALFAGMSYATEAQFGIVSIVIGVLAGMGAARGGRGTRAQIIGAVAAAIGYFVGQILAVAAVVGSPFFDLPMEIYLELIRLLLEQTFSTMDALFLAIAVYEGWRIPRVRT